MFIHVLQQIENYIVKIKFQFCLAFAHYFTFFRPDLFCIYIPYKGFLFEFEIFFKGKHRFSIALVEWYTSIACIFISQHDMVLICSKEENATSN